MSAREKLKRAFLFLLPFAAVISVWEVIARLGAINPNLLPPPSQIFLSFLDLTLKSKVLHVHLYESLYRMLAGFLLGTSAGICLGMLMGASKTVRQLFSPIIALFISIPTIAWVPALLITVGVGSKTVILAIFLASFFPLTYSTMNGIRSVDKQVIRAAQITGASTTKIFWHVLLPGALTALIPGLRLAVGYSWRALVGAEMLAATKWGIGHMIYAARAFYVVKVMFVGLAIIGIVGFLMDRLLMDWIESRTIERWGMVSRR